MEILFDYERLDVYQLGRELNREVAAINSELPRGAGEAGDNLRRSCASITRNLAEANGKWTAADKAMRYYIVRGSGMEAGASLDELVDCGYVAPGRVTHARRLASRIVSMVTGLIRALGPEYAPPRKGEPKIGAGPVREQNSDTPGRAELPPREQPPEIPAPDRNRDRNRRLPDAESGARRLPEPPA